MNIVILSGVPGSGKSHYAVEHIRRKHRYYYCSADDYFMTRDGVYQFDATKLPEAHGQCLRTYVEEVVRGPDAVGVVIVDNTNITVEELAPYVALASAYRVPVKLVTILCDPIKAHSRNGHGVPLHAVQRMDAALRARKLPPYWNVELETVEG